MHATAFVNLWNKFNCKYIRLKIIKPLLQTVVSLCVYSQQSSVPFHDAASLRLPLLRSTKVKAERPEAREREGKKPPG